MARTRPNRANTTELLVYLKEQRRLAACDLDANELRVASLDRSIAAIADGFQIAATPDELDDPMRFGAA